MAKMADLEQRNRCLSHKTKLEKILLVFVVVLFAIVALFLYLYLTKLPKEAGVDNRKAKSMRVINRSKICTRRSCVLNAAELMEKMNQSVDPCDDFYSYACGKYNGITSHLNFVHVLKQLQDDNTKYLKTIIENTNVRDHYAKNPALSKLFQVYDMCMDCRKFEDTAMSSFKKLMRRLGDSNITLKEWSKSDYNIFDVLVKGTRLKFNIFFFTGVRMNPKNNSKHIFFVDKPTLGLNIRSYLPKKTPKDDKIRESYKAYMITMLKMVAANPRDVPMAVDEILRLEKRIAKILLRFHNDYSILTLEELSTFTKFDWLSFVENLTSDINYQPNKKDVVVLRSKAVIKHIIYVIETTDKRVLSNFVTWKILQDCIPAMESKFSRIEQKFKNSIQRGHVEQIKQWQRCIKILSESFHQVLNFLYVEQKFSEDSRRKAFHIFREIRNEFVDSLVNKTWMDEQTKAAAAEKAGQIHFLVGSTNETKNIEKMNIMFQKLKINGSNFFETYLNQRRFAFKKSLDKLLNPVQRNSFEQRTWEANAYYSKEENKISFMAGILQPSIYSNNNNRASNYGSLGMIVGHELTHAFDSNGHKYDRNGNRRNWWTANSLKNFQERTTCFTQQYDKFTILGHRVKGKNTLGENIADNGGLKLAYNAFKREEKQHDEEQLPGLNLTNDQVFFLSFAQVWCSKYTKEALNEIIDHRVPMMFRVTGPLRNSVEFSNAYRCPVGSRMNPVRKCAIW